MTTKHTPGPWSAIKVYSDAVSVVDAGGFELVETENIAILSEYSKKLNISHWEQSEDAYRVLNDEEQAANARLIAAAPELLQALQKLLDLQVAKKELEYLDKGIGTKTPNAAWLEARSAVAKARGEQ